MKPELKKKNGSKHEKDVKVSITFNFIWHESYKPKYKSHKSKYINMGCTVLVGWLVILFKGTSTLVDHLMPNCFFVNMISCLLVNW